MKKNVLFLLLTLSSSLWAKDPFLSPELSRILQQANQNNPQMQFELGKRYYTGNGIGSDKQNALFWLAKSATQNYLPAQRALGILFLDGDGEVSANPKQAIEWLEQAAKQNDPIAIGLLAKTYKDGVFVKADYVKATEWAERGAALDNAEAQYILGDLYRQGLNQQKDLTAAAKLYQKAADQGHIDAINNIGAMLNAGFGIEADPILGYAYWLVGQDLGSDLARKNIENRDAKKPLSEKEKAEAVAKSKLILLKISQIK